MIYRLMVICSIFLAAMAQMLLKRAAVERYGSVIREYLNLRVVGGYSLMLVSLLVNIFAMGRGVMVKEVAAFESLGYVFVPLLSFFIFGERLSARKVLAIAIIIVGVIVFSI